MFEINKKTTLSKCDKSSIGGIDKPIQKLCKIINDKENYYTTSSCSGRIVLRDGFEKTVSKWLFVSHNLIKLEEIKPFLNNEEVWIRSEPMILHVSCKTIEDAINLVNLARNNGFKRAGIQSLRKNIVEISCSSSIVNTILSKNGKILVDENYLSILVDECNNKLKKTHEKIKRFEEIFKKIKN
ncbi:hypothetical protein KY334_00930 [Candidatus Woesearchaeota archaeon]|nr:hypothetical protein [Candidatus Woesearchaeota archaeon]